MSAVLTQGAFREVDLSAEGGLNFLSAGGFAGAVGVTKALNW